MTPEALLALMEATWPAASRRRLGPFTLRDGDGGGKRVSAASLESEFTAQDLLQAEAAMPDPLFLIAPDRPLDRALDQALAARGYGLIDPVLAYAAPVGAIAGPLPALSAFAHWPPLASTAEIWAEGEITAPRLRVMQRTKGPRTAILGRHEDRPSGAVFVALHGQQAMIHALQVRPDRRRQSCGAVLLRAAANWAAEQGARDLALVVTRQNLAARALYTRAGMQVVGEYHYRQRPPQAGSLNP